MLTRLSALLLLCLLLSPIQGWAQQLRFRIVSYNVENFFDCTDHPQKADDEYLPHGLRHWTPRRYRHKLNEVAKTLLALGHDGEAPALVGLCEVENDTVLHALTRQSPLRNVGYRYVITSSADVRGINIALLYRPDCFRLLSVHSIRANLPGQRPTRDVLHVSGTFITPSATSDTLDLFMLHLPSRMGGTHETTPYRLHVAQAVRTAIDSLSHVRRRPNLLVMGDFNETAKGPVLTQALQARPLPGHRHAPTSRTDLHSSAATPSASTPLYQLLSPRHPSSLPAIKGSYKYQGHWELIDHLLAGGALLQAPRSSSSSSEGPLQSVPRGHLHLLPETAQVAPLPFLLTADLNYGGQCPLRTYYGATYLGGYSDHLPLTVELIVE